MRASTHVAICQIFIILSFIAAPLLLCSLSGSFPQSLAVIAVYALLWFGTIYWLPVLCETPDCARRMRRSLERKSFLTQKLLYRCPVCANTHDGEILYPDITFEARG